MAILGLLVIAGTFGSPLWITLIILGVPERYWPVDLVLCGLQAGIIYLLWWFFWVGGIGVEARLSPTCQWWGVIALLPVIVSARKHLFKS